MTLPAFAAERRRLHHGARSYRSISAVDAEAQQQTRRPPLMLSIAGTDRRTDARLLRIGLYTALHSMRAAPVT